MSHSRICVDLLNKVELTYEIIARGRDVDNTTTVAELRKILRTLNKLNIKMGYQNIRGKYNAAEEWGLILEAAENIKTLVGEACETKRLNDITRCEAKIKHYENRLTLVKLLTQQNKNTNEASEKIIEIFAECRRNIAESGVTADERANYSLKISENGEAEENLIEDLETQPRRQGSLEPSQPDCHFERESPRPMVLTGLYNKLTNPVEKMLSKQRNTNGLNGLEVLELIKTMLKLNEEMGLSVKDTLDVIIDYTSGPLHSKITNLRYLTSMRAVHCELIKTFIPTGMMLRLQTERVHRVQAPGEALSVYVENVKENAKLLLSDLSERELVNVIKQGLLPEERSRLVFCGNPQTFAELENACIEAQNIAYNDRLRNQGGSWGNNRNTSYESKPRWEPGRDRNVPNRYVNRNESRPQNRSYPSPGNNNSPPRKCFKCDQVGHYANNCPKTFVPKKDIVNTAHPKN